MKPIVLTILDGVGLRKEEHGNAFLQADKPNFNYLINTYPHSELEASGEAVGLPTLQMGNSEVGHMNIGAGHIVYQPLQLINNAIKDNSFYHNNILLKAVNHAKQNNSKLHILGLLSDGGVHSHINHIIAMLELCKRNNFYNIYFHVFTDGRDTLSDVAYTYVKELKEKIKEYGFGAISTLAGRFYAMDRDNRWDRTKKAYDALISGIGDTYKNPEEAIKNSYNKKIYDEFIEPIVFNKEGLIEDNDSIIFANFRPDRATQLLTSISNPLFKEFEAKKLKNIVLISLMACSESVISDKAFALSEPTDTLGAYLSKLSYTQLRIAETEKYAHVTYFFDGGKDKILSGCDRILVNSPKVKTYDLKPEMSANEVTDKLLEAIDTDKYDLIILNYANCDMVGHTGDMKATIKAVETVDLNLGKVYKKVIDKKGLLIVVADHGNCEYMLDDNNHPITTHTTNKVPFIICNKDYKVRDGKLGDVAPTILKIMNLNIPEEMTGEILI
ncbi:MAG: 2,3-bisphosphoglycerate-independent phosphoglycerate mutase [Bacilli bacterium]|nr:2,3-bisphosphoglycerate-independent phosphoglycerate mutase [Bacilli bacterium]